MAIKFACSVVAIIGLASVPVGVAGQEDKVKSETKLEVKDGKDVTLDRVRRAVIRIRMGRHRTS